MSDVVVTIAESTTDVNVTDSVVNIDVTETSVQVIAANEEVVVAQVQVDWEESDTASFAYIKNKPDFTEDTLFTVVGGTDDTQPTFNGSPLFTGSYIKLGSQVHFQIQVDFDNITSFGTGQYYVELPFISKYNMTVRAGCLHDFSNGNSWAISGHVFAGSKTLKLFYTSGTGQDEVFDHNSPINLNVADNFHIAGNYITQE